MDKVAHLSTAERLKLFEQVSARRNIAFEIVEKDFWVCWILDVLFGIPEFKNTFIFKGWTSLSKCFNVIERFSEDIDISITRETLGFTGGKDPEKQSSKTKTAKAVKDMRAACQEFVKREIYPKFDEAVRKRTSAEWPPIWGHRVISITEDGSIEEGVITFVYPQTKDSVSSYIPQAVRIEFGASSDPYPISQHRVTSYAEEHFPHLFQEVKNEITVLNPERTFWEKVTLAHAEYHRPKDSKTPPRQSRHYYDLFRLGQTAHGTQALQDQALPKRVVEHKSVYFRSGWANYSAATEGNLRLVPHPSRLVDLENDYEKMKLMVFGEIPTWDEIIKFLRTIENEINKR